MQHGEELSCIEHRRTFNQAVFETLKGKSFQGLTTLVMLGLMDDDRVIDMKS
jgi:hypothetical protein